MRIIRMTCVAVVMAAAAVAALATPVFAQWPTTCVDLNDIVEAHLGNDNNVGIYQRAFGDQAEQACQDDHRDDVRGVFAWVFEEAPQAAVADLPDLAWPTGCLELNDIVEAHLGNHQNVGIYQRVFVDHAEAGCRNDHRADVRGVFGWAFQGLPWVTDGLTGRDRRALDEVLALSRIDPSISQRVEAAPWLADGVTARELRLLADLRSLTVLRPDIASVVAAVPDRSGILVAGVLNSVQSFLSGDRSRSERLLGQSWFRDGLTEEEAALVVVLRSATGSDEVFDDLVHGGHVRSRTVSLPLAGEVDLFAVGRSETELEETLGRMRFAAESMENFMGTPWPMPDVVAFLELESDLGGAAAGWNAGDHVGLRGASKNLTYHELAHYYFGAGAHVPFWLSEGSADFLMLHTLALSGDIPPVHSTFETDREAIDEHCAPHGSANVQGWIDTEGGITYCPYLLGRHYLQGLYLDLGHGVVSSALRGLFECGSATGSVVTEDDVFQAFLRATPGSQHDQFHVLYQRLHGRPIPGGFAASGFPSSAQTRDALVKLYQATNGDGWKSSENWLSEAPVNQWAGVVADCSGTIIGLDLPDNQLAGSLPPELGNLTQLRLIGLGDNQLRGSIPDTLGRLTELRELHVYRNNLEGGIPATLGNLRKLHTMDLGENRLSGEIPPSLGDMNLRWVSLSGNALHGPIPPALGRLTDLGLLNLSRNRLSGQIPAEMQGLINLTWLGLAGNRLEGPLPAWLGTLGKLQFLDLAGNSLHGPILPELGRLSELEGIVLADNQLTGKIPADLGNLSKLREVFLGGNQLEGCVPPALRNVPRHDLGRLGLPTCPS